MNQDTTTTRGAADLLDLIEAYAEARRRQGHSSYNAQTAAALQAVKDALAAGQATAAPAEPDPTPGDHPQPCDSELFESGVSVGLFDIPQWTAEALCKGIAAATGARVDWHYIGGRVHVKALPAPTSAEGVAYAALPTSNYAGRVYEEGFLIGTCPLYSADQMRAFADATHTMRASHGQAPAQPDPAYSAACHLATALFKKYFAHLPDFASGQAVWGLCGSTAGVISQIDNMVSGLLQPPTTAFSEDEL